MRENAKTPRLEINEIPEVMRTRLFSLRAFDAAGMMLDADVVHGRDVEPLIQRMLGNERVDVHPRSQRKARLLRRAYRSRGTK